MKGKRMANLTNETLTQFVKDNLFIYLDEFEEKLSKEFNVSRDDIKINIVDHECFIRVASDNEVIPLVLKMDELNF